MPDRSHARVGENRARARGKVSSFEKKEERGAENGLDFFFRIRTSGSVERGCLVCRE